MLTQYQKKRICDVRRVLKQLTTASVKHHVKVLSRTFVVLPNVWSPKFSGTTRFAAQAIAKRRIARIVKNKTILELGTGTGGLAVTAVYAGAKRVVATDINPCAVDCARYNIKQHHLEKHIIVRCGDLFQPIRKDECFDIILFNPPFIYVPPNYRHRTYLERAVLDPGYALQRRFLATAKKYLNPGGFLLVSFSNAGMFSLFLKNVREAGWSSILLKRSKKDYDRRLYKLLPKHPVD